MSKASGNIKSGFLHVALAERHLSQGEYESCMARIRMASDSVRVAQVGISRSKASTVSDFMRLTDRLKAVIDGMSAAIAA